MRCEKCGKYESEYVAPKEYCRYCWLGWWYEGEPEDQKKKLIDEAVKKLDEQFGKNHEFRTNL